MSPPIAPSRDLLFGLLALQNGLINQVQLVAAFQAWTLDKARALADHLIALGYLNDAQKAVVEAMADLHVAKHGDVERSLAAIPADRPTRESLAQLGDPDIDGMLARVGARSTQQDGEADPDRTASYAVGMATSYAVGMATSDGQRFRVVRPHARGGLGAVFVALDTELHREVALKQILDSHADDPVSRQRFLLEAEVTGGLEHPGIVPVYGLGVYPDGRPYYAMRFIRGDSLKEAIERFHADAALRTDAGRRSLELRKLLRRFLDVCNAIDYAHSRGVLHRDIKPGNVIVGRYGETLVVDWGLAKATGKSDPSAGERTLQPSSTSGSAETLPGSAMGTPAYMSPEQAEGDLDRLGPRSDVYSLGATLYCLLTGQPPLEGGDIAAILRAAQRGEFRPPRIIDASIDRALEAVCLKAMALKPEDRYSSCRALAEDLERWTADEPVTAWREPLPSRARRWVRRNRTAVTAAAVAVVVAMVGMASVLAVQTKANSDLKAANLDLANANARTTQANAGLQAANERERASRDSAQRRFELARQAIEQYYTGASEDVLLKQPELKALRAKLLTTCLGFYKKLQAELASSDDPATRAELAAAYARVGEIVGQVGSEVDAREAYGRAIAIREALAHAEPAAAGARRELAALLEKLGLLEVLIAGRRAEGIRKLEQAIALREAIAAGHSGDVDDRRAIAASHRMIASAQFEMGDAAECLRSLEQARSIAEQLVSDHPAVATFRHELAKIHWSLAARRQLAGRLAEAFSSQREAVTLLERLVSEHPDNIDYRQELGKALSIAGSMRNHASRPSEALSFFERALEIQKRLAADYPTATLHQYELARLHMLIGRSRQDLGRPAEALGSLQWAAARLERLIADQPAIAVYKDNLAFTQLYIGQAQAGLGRLAEARRALERAIEHHQGVSTVVDLYNLACAESRLSALFPSDPAGGTDVARTDREAHAERAVAALRRAVAAGYGDLAHMRIDPDLDPIRSRPDFQLLLMDLAFPPDPFSKDTDADR
jgi:serine/threonine-protein kinase